MTAVKERAAPSNKAMKLTRLSAAPGLSCTSGVDGGAASYPRRRETAGTGSQLIAGVRLTTVVHPRGNGEAVRRESQGPPRVSNRGATARRPWESLLPRTSAGVRVGGRVQWQGWPTTACHSLGWDGKRASAIERVGSASHAGQLGVSSGRRGVAGSCALTVRRQALLVGFTRQRSGSSRQYRWSRGRSRTRR